MFDRRLLAPQNQCEFTSLEVRLPCLYPNIKMYYDNHKRNRVIYFDGVKPVACMFIENKTVMGMYVVPDYRRQGIAQNLYALCSVLFKGISIDENRTKLGELFARKVLTVK